MDIKKSTYVVAVCLALLGATGCGGSDELSDKDIEEIEDYLDESDDGSYDAGSDESDSYEEDDDEEDWY